MSPEKPFDDYDPRAWLERAALVFLHHNCFASAIGAFSRLVEAEPGYSMGWYGLANALYCLSGEKGDLALLRNAVSSAKRALETDAANEMAKQLLEWVPQRTPLSEDDVTTAETFTTVPADLAGRTGFTENTFADDMEVLPQRTSRMQIVMWLGMFKEPFGTEILLRALDDSDPDVRMAALKRLDPDDEDMRVRAKLERLAFSDAGASTEPYLSMALRRFARDSPDSDHWAARILKAIRSGDS